MLIVQLTTTRVEAMQLERIIQNSSLTLEKVINYITSLEVDKSSFLNQSPGSSSELSSQLGFLGL